MARFVHGIRKWGPLQIDDEGHRSYGLGVLLRTTDKYDGPAQMYNTPGTPTPGSAWSFGNDNDVWAFCKNTCTVSRYGYEEDSAVEGEPNPWIFWLAEYTFSTKPPDSSRQRCDQNQIENPLLEPYRYSGDFKRYTEEAYFDMYGRGLFNSAWQRLRGQQVEFDKNRPGVVIEQNVPDLQLPLLSAFMDCVNDRPMWGLPARTIKLSNAPWEKIYYGTCYYYFKRRLEFEINYETWDRLILDDSDAVLNGHWHETTRHWVVDPINGAAPDRFNPTHFIQYKDPKGENSRVILDGYGLPAGACIDYYNAIDPDDIAPDVYISLAGTVGAPNTGKALQNKDWWIKWAPARPAGEASFAIPPNGWNENILYKPGNTVRTGGLGAEKDWVCLINNISDIPLVGNPLTTQWQLLGDGLHDKGTYSATTDYVTGDYVLRYPSVGSPPGTGSHAPCKSRDVGTKLIQKYFPANFLLLGVPLLLPV